MINTRTNKTEYSTRNVYTGKLNFRLYDDIAERTTYKIDEYYSAVEKVTPYTYKLITRSKSDVIANQLVTNDEELRQLSLPLKDDKFIDSLEPINKYTTDTKISKREIEGILSLKNGKRPLSKVKRLWN